VTAAIADPVHRVDRYAELVRVGANVQPSNGRAVPLIREDR